MQRSFVAIITFVFGLSMSSCHNEGKNTSSITRPAVAVDSASFEQNLGDSLTVEEGSNNIQEIVSSIVNGDKIRLASLSSYPIMRKYPLPDIENARQMVAYFDTLFDRSYRKMLAKEKLDDKEAHGWRGFSLGKGTLWIYDSLYAVDYSSAKEKRKLDRLRRKEMKSLNVRMRNGGWTPYACYKDLTDKSYVRIDANEDSIFRLAIYDAGLKASDMPEFIIYGKLFDNWKDVSSEEGYITSELEPSLRFSFSNGTETIEIGASVFELEEDGALPMYWNSDKFERCHWLKPCRWPDEMKK